MEKVQAAFDAGAGTLRRNGAGICAEFARLYNAKLAAHTGRRGERKLLFETRMRQPQPKVSSAGQRRDPHLGQRTRFARVENRLLQADGERPRFPIDLNVGGTYAHRIVIRTREEV